MTRAELAAHFHQTFDSRQPPIDCGFLQPLINQLGFIFQHYRHSLTLFQVQKFQNVVRYSGYPVKVLKSH